MIETATTSQKCTAQQVSSLRPRTVAEESQKCSSILAYLNEVADNLHVRPPTHQACHADESCGAGLRPSLDQPNRPEVSPGNRRRWQVGTDHHHYQEPQWDQWQRSDPGHGGPGRKTKEHREEKDRKHLTSNRIHGRVPWDGSMKNSMRAATATRTITNATATSPRDRNSPHHEHRGDDRVGHSTTSQVYHLRRSSPTPAPTANNVGTTTNRSASRLDRGRRERYGHAVKNATIDVTNVRRTSAPHYPDRVNDDHSGGSDGKSRCFRSDGDREYEVYPHDHDENSGTSGTAATTSTSITSVSEERHGRRWVWDEWDVDSFTQSQDHQSSITRNRDDWTGRGNVSSYRHNGRKPKLSLSSPRRGNSTISSPFDAVFRDGSRPIPAKHDYNAGSVNGAPPRSGTEAAKQAFEDVQATAHGMKEDLSQGRSKVLELKTSLQRVRASNERRRQKLTERWLSSAVAAAAQREEATERQRVFARQLEKDVENMEEKLGALERQISRLREGRDRDCALARAECTKELKKAREACMAAEKGRLHRLSEKKAAAIKQAAVRALEPQLSELVTSNRAEARSHAEDLEVTLQGLHARLERESDEKVQTEAKDYQTALEAEVEEERRLGEHQLRLLARGNEAEIQEFREATRRDLEGERVRFEADRKRVRDAAAKELEGTKAAEAERAKLTLAEHGRELREAEQAHRREEDETRRRLSKETEKWQRQVLAAARKEAEEKEQTRKREIREKCEEDLEMVLSRLEADATKTREAADAEQQKEAATEAAVRARELGTAQELETRATERYLDGARRQVELESETQAMEQEVEAMSERLREESERLATAEQQSIEGRKRWRARLESLRQECSAERTAAGDEASRLSARLEEAEEATRRAAGVAEGEVAGLRASLATEFAQVEAKVAAVLKRKSDQAKALGERLSTLQQQTKAREEDLSDYRRRTFS